MEAYGALSDRGESILRFDFVWNSVYALRMPHALLGPPTWRGSLSLHPLVQVHRGIQELPGNPPQRAPALPTPLLKF